MTKAKMFTPINLGSSKVSNRIAMAPMTRSRSVEGDVITPMASEYYGQRAAAGLIITEGAPISPVGRGYSLTPGIYTKEQINAWKDVTKAVHDRGGKIFVQLWHVGRRSHSSIAGEQPVAPSAVKVPDMVWGPLPEGGFGMIETDAPRAMTAADLEATKADFVQAAKNAMKAGFDGVELHGAHGYLLDTFMRKASNVREDEYGGSIANRLRYPLEVTQAVAEAIGSDHTAIRISPFVAEGAGEFDDEIETLSLEFLKALNPLRLAYVHLSENISKYKEVPESYRKQVREVYQHPVMVAGKLTKESAEELLEKDYADMVAFGQPFIVNPDLVERFANNWEVSPVREGSHATFYGGGAEGYTDYPTYKESMVQQ